MALPAPEPGLVLCYEFLWRHEHEAGAEVGRKRRPCAIIVATRTERGQTSVIVAPITHTPPVPQAEGIEVPPRVKIHLGLDAQRSWIIVSDLNRFTWPGFDLYPVPGSRDRYDYGFLPPSLFRLVRDRVLALDASLKKATARD